MDERQEYLVNCTNCGAALKVNDGAEAYQCPVCKKLFSLCKPESECDECAQAQEEFLAESVVEEAVVAADTVEELAIEETVVEEPAQEAEEKQSCFKTFFNKVKSLFKK